MEHDFTVVVTAGVSEENNSLYIPHNDQVKVFVIYSAKLHKEMYTFSYLVTY
jgi:hypothetical protein